MKPVGLPDSHIRFGVKPDNLKPVEFRDLFNESGYEKCPTMDVRQVRRSVTPAGFAEQFFKSNK